jgi:hypothetical protein
VVGSGILLKLGFEIAAYRTTGTGSEKNPSAHISSL